MFAIVAVPMRAEMGFSESQFALLVALPVLTGSVLRIPVGLLADVVGGRKSMTCLLVATAIPTFLVSQVNSFDQALVLAAFVGLAGTTFAAGASWVSVWQPASKQGLALGVFGAGNVGASITKLFAPALITLVGAGGMVGGILPGGWRFVPVVYAAMLCGVAVATYVFAPREDRRPSRGRAIAQRLKPLSDARVWRFGMYYVTVFGAYVGLALWLPEYLVGVYGLDLVKAGIVTSLFIFPASLLRPLGGLLSDRFGARLVTLMSLTSIAVLATALCLPLNVTSFVALIVLTGVAMGVGKASVFALIPLHYPRDVGSVAGLVGAIGGLGGFILPIAFSSLQNAANDARATFVVLLAVALLSIACLAVAGVPGKSAVEGANA
ncbi:MAG: NarK/NasA family nitrate transporter [Actinobacteria bacterium]|nr:NarK/NasA family nitrate transporter [Actinomycetota bacterium]